MLAILSPAKNMHRVPTPPHATRPMFLQQTETLAASMKRYAPFQLESVLKVNPQLALRAFTDIQDWNASIPGSPALLSYHGLAYSALDAATLSREDLTFAQDTLRILSAFYGVLRPLDNILPHRLDFESSFRCCGKTMYEFWGSMLHDAVFQEGRSFTTDIEGFCCFVGVIWDFEGTYRIDIFNWQCLCEHAVL